MYWQWSRLKKTFGIMNNETTNVSELIFLGSCNDMWCYKDTCDCDDDCPSDSCNDCGCDDHRWG